ncbi:MAG TPA: ectoine/hydroxyectoine ABC transporter substrate-binding protein EhuB [Pseudonocardia sp.]|jgi:polar amino acid transport system substrate-binding protein|uniref:ectoine/hydroxyectoine ABC transporter substrate-binding protein EhuB n=1 Tax=Pseudonocardia sp. TaxID=60912 RepID=UPI002B4AFB47|nr:ectoine/hydroxyectoine ABC transporter substrate-binding protein EhuB [Pseudonocardia sp.]HLU56551.1 ectoine/hydroxyectoine ABC transporter substrate-binding protein EhuB [Pseudonocardia sp.]
MLSRRRLLALAVPTAALAACSRPEGTSLERARAVGAIRIGISGERPYSYTNPDGRVTGAQPEVARIVLDRIGVPGLEAVRVPFHQLLPRLRDGQYDLVAAGMTITPERCREVAFSRPDFVAYPAFLVREGNPPGVRTFQGVARAHLRLAVIEGTVEIDYARAAGVTDDQLVIVASQSEMLRAVSEGRVDAGALTRLSLLDELRRNPGSGLVVTAPVEPTADGRPVVPAAGFAVRHGETDLLAEFDRELAALQASGEWLRITEPFGFTRDNLPPPELTTEDLCRPERP